MALRTGVCSIIAAPTLADKPKVFSSSTRKDLKINNATYKMEKTDTTPVMSEKPVSLLLHVRKLLKRYGTIAPKIDRSPTGTVVYNYTGPKQFWS